LVFRARRITCSLAALTGSIALTLSTGHGVASGDDRTISFYHIHTQETLTIQYKKDGQYLPDALKKINWLMRDWRKNQVIDIDPKTIDIIWEMHEELGSKEPVHVICGYRSRDTNEMLRKTRGGQASQSQHITGKAIDISFPDVSARQMRYSAMIRERGGVGYYPTSGIPFVHVDTSRVRHWPRMPRDELALLFPSGHSKHEPADGRPITPADVRAARERSKDVAVEVAQFYALRDAPKTPVMVASLTAPAPKPAARPQKAFDAKMAVGARTAEDAASLAPEALPPVIAPKLVVAPKPVDRPSRFAKAVPEADRSRLDMLVTLASLDEKDDAQKPAKPKFVSASMGSGPIKLAALEPMAPQPEPARAITDAGARTAWVSAPEFDEDHPEELSYRPFPLAPLLTDTASYNDPALTTLVHPDAAKAIDAIDDEGGVPPLRLRPGQQTAAMMWAQEFRGEAVSLTELDGMPAETGSIAGRSVKTTSPR
jgi:uncharacterized protein YcbK (DUF882 family)